MAQDPSEDPPATPPLVTSSHGGGKPMLFVGVVGACALGVSAGLWARPHEDERRVAPVVAKVAQAPKPARTLEIVLDDQPAPIGAPIEVLPAIAGRPAVLPPEMPTDTAPLTPLRPPTGLVRVQAIEPIEVEPQPAPKPMVKVERVAPPKALDVAKAKESPKVAKAEARPAKTEKAERKLAKAEPSKPKAAKPKDEVKLAKGEKAAKAKIQAAEKKAGKLARELAKTAPAKVKQAETRLADARKARAAEKKREEARAEAARLEKKRKLQLAKAEAVRAEKLRAERARVEKVKAEKVRAEKARLQKAALKKVAPKPEPAPPVARLPKPTRDNPIRKASNRCVSSDPGAALVCADPSLGAADRQLARAYEQAQAAGVSTARLARQQERWLAARAQAAKEAPWAVRDVYEARIAELNDMTRDAGRSY